MNIQGLNILLTRPEGQQQELQQMLQQAGAEIYSYPVLVIVGMEEKSDLYQACKQQWLRLDEFHHVIFISTNAVRYGLEWMNQYWPQLPVGINWYAIGTATATALQREGLEASQATSGMDSEALLKLPSLQLLSNEKVLIVRGAGGRDYLRQQLQARGAVVDYVECYRRLLPAAPEGELARLMKHQQFDVICVHSGESLQNLFTLLGADQALATRTPLLVPGQRVADIARKLGCQQVIVAENASSAGIISALQGYSLS